MKFLLCKNEMKFMPPYAQAYFISAGYFTILIISLMPSGINFIKKSTSISLADFLVTRTGLSPLAARPAPPLLMASFAASVVVDRAYRRQSVLLSQNGSHPRSPYDTRNISKKEDTSCIFLFAGDPYGTRTHVTTVKGWCLNRLTNGPYIKRKFRIVIMVAAMRFELMTYRV